ncbi:AraC-type DNA-binding protein [Dyadobacter koreensis]|uniref:AraC-type DNA-binding protein n=1 Tax=Dyadobacter koreensis TaxID=408657 RepID=A0A1H6UVB8_9BACT|nr:helix-turn-helix transcriptional regulator [Dyadobacter koreensis]SEI92015.1 AraC-type DNA-binding protein [Dyadobacter koreensis]
MITFLQPQELYKNAERDTTQHGSNAGHFDLIRVEDLEKSSSDSLTYRRQTYYKASIVKGLSKIHYADQCIEIDGTALVFTNPVIPYHWERISAEQIGFVCIFMDDFLNKFGSIGDYHVFSSSAQAIIPMNQEQEDFFSAAFVRISSELHGDYQHKYDLIRCILMEIIHEAQKLQPAVGTQVSHAKAMERVALLFYDLLESQFPIRHIHERIKLKSPGSFADSLNIHVNYLNKALKEVRGETTSAQISNRILQEAKILLKSTTWTVSEIAWCLHFDEPNHFSAFFKKNTGFTPSEFRQ